MAGMPEQQLAKLKRQLARLDDAEASGVLTVEGADGTGRVTYRDLDDMIRARGRLARRIADLEGAADGTPVRRTRRVVMIGGGGW